MKRLPRPKRPRLIPKSVLLFGIPLLLVLYGLLIYFAFRSYTNQRVFLLLLGIMVIVPPLLSLLAGRSITRQMEALDRAEQEQSKEDFPDQP